MMEVALPMPGSTIDSYEDMFKEITRKLYGEDGLPDLTNSDRSGQERGLTPIDYDVDTPILKPEEHITAFGLAALMQNGFTPSGILNSTFQQCKSSYEDKWIASEDNLQWTQSKIASYNPAQKLFKCAECDCVGYLHRVTEHWLGTHSNLRAFQCPQCPYESAWARCVRIHLSRQHNINSEDATELLLKNNPVVQEISRYLQCLKSKLENKHNNTLLDDINSTTNNSNNTRQTMQTTGDSTPNSSNSSKRYNCTYCPYATDRRDLYTRHENIHREEKPFQCYVCQKQFNRADHVKKHFLRMHREHPYDLNRIRRHPPKNSSGMSFYQKYNSTITASEMQESVSSLSLTNQLTIPNSFSPRNSSSNNIRTTNVDMKNTFKSGLLKNGSKKKGEKRFTCCYCSWSGVDNWCLKRHMNTHLKPFICNLCDYKAARSERLATHVLKVHNKRACSKCNFLADDMSQLTAHQHEHHPLDRNRNTNAAPVRNSLYLNGSASHSTNTFNQNQVPLKNSEYNAATSTSYIQQHNNRLLPGESKPWKNQGPKQQGIRLFNNYMEAAATSDGSDCDSSVEELNRGLSERLQSDFPEAGDVGMTLEETEGEELELPLFVCAMCGCEFEDDRSLDMHQYTHHRHSTTSPAMQKYSKEGKKNYRCCVCDQSFTSQTEVMTHMQTHMNLHYNSSSNDSTSDKENQNKRSRKQSQPKKVLVPFWESEHNFQTSNGKTTPPAHVPLVEKYITKLLKKKRYTCNLCRNLRICQFTTKSRLILHQRLKHNKNRFECEHCNMVFRHRYQVVLHSSRQHINLVQKLPEKTVVPIKDCYNSSTESIPEEANNYLQNLSTDNPVHKIGMSLFDHSFLHPNTGFNSHMPLIIPTFPPN